VNSVFYITPRNEVKNYEFNDEELELVLFCETTSLNAFVVDGGGYFFIKVSLIIPYTKMLNPWIIVDVFSNVMTTSTL